MVLGLDRDASALAEAFSQDGYAASTTAQGLGIQLCQHHCPVQHVAAEFPQLCDAETAALGRLLDVHVDEDHNRSVFTLVGTESELADALVAGVRVAAGGQVVGHAGGRVDGVPAAEAGDGVAALDPAEPGQGGHGVGVRGGAGGAGQAGPAHL